MNAQPDLHELMARHLLRQAGAHASGLVPHETGEVVPFDAGAVPAVDPRLAWEEALAVVQYCGPEVEPPKAPPDWTAVASGHEPMVALAFAVGNFPQLLRSLQPLIAGARLSSLRPAPERALSVPALAGWARDSVRAKNDFMALVGAGALRLAGQFQEAASILAGEPASSEWQAAWENERAALAWHQGDAERARDLWRRQEPNLPVLFNRGMAGLFLDSPDRGSLEQAVAGLPERSAWHHLGRLYLTFADLQG